MRSFPHHNHFRRRTVRTVLLVHNFPTPYRMPLFERLGNIWDLTVWFCSPGEIGRKWSNSSTHIDGVNTRVLPSVRLGPLIVNYTVAFEAARAQVDLVVISDDLANVFASLCMTIVFKLRSIPVVLWTERVLGSVTFPGQSSIRHLAYKWARKFLVCSADAIVCMSGEASVNEIKALTPRFPRIFKGTQVMPINLLPPRQPRPDGAAGYLLFLGYFRPEKDIPALVSAFRSVATPDSVLVIAGDGPLRGELERLVKDIPNIVIRGYVTGDEKARLIMSAGALILPSMWESWGLVVNEGLHFGTPIIACEGIGAAELVKDGVNGLIFQWDAEGMGLRAVLRRFLSDASLRGRLVAGARETSSEVISDVQYGTRHIEEAIRSFDAGLESR